MYFDKMLKELDDIDSEYLKQRYAQLFKYDSLDSYFKFVVDPNIDWPSDLGDPFEFEIVPTPTPRRTSTTGCENGVHYRNTTPIALAEKQFEQWYVCKKCGKPLRKAG